MLSPAQAFTADAITKVLVHRDDEHAVQHCEARPCPLPPAMRLRLRLRVRLRLRLRLRSRGRRAAELTMDFSGEW